MIRFDINEVSNKIMGIPGFLFAELFDLSQILVD